MFDEIRARLRGIDLVLNTVLLERFREDEFLGLEYLREKGQEEEAKFVLLKLALEDKTASRSYTQQYLRGFEELLFAHSGAATHFLKS